MGNMLQRESVIHSVALCSTHCTTEPPCTEVGRRARSAPMRGLRVMVMVVVPVMVAVGVVIVGWLWAVGSGLWALALAVSVWRWVCPEARWGDSEVRGEGGAYV